MLEERERIAPGVKELTKKKVIFCDGWSLNFSKGKAPSLPYLSKVSV